MKMAPLKVAKNSARFTLSFRISCRGTELDTPRLLSKSLIQVGFQHEFTGKNHGFVDSLDVDLTTKKALYLESRRNNPTSSR